MVDIIEVTEVTPSLVSAFERLIPQLSSSSPPPSEEALRTIVDSSACHLLVAESADQIVGSLTLVVFPIPTGVRAWIEDVVVDQSARGQGIGRRLTEHALDLARRLGAKTVDLTSRPSRGAANRLYRDVGFQFRETNVYRYEL